MADLIPAFTSHYSPESGSLLTLAEPGKAKPGAPVSVFDLGREVGLTEILLVEDRIDGFVQAYKTSEKLGAKLCYGIKFVVCQDLADKDPRSRGTESKVIVFVRDTEGYSKLVSIWNRAWTDGHFTHRNDSYGRTDWRSLKAQWSPHLMLGLPFFSSFLAKNTLTTNRVVPDLPDLAPGGAPLWVMKEMGSQLPFAPLIDMAIDRYVEGARVKEYGLGVDVVVVPIKTIYYSKRTDFKAYMIRRCIGQKSAIDAPDVDHLASDQFCLESYKELVAHS
jgi:DNA polymerase III alpha subunit